MIFIEMVGTSMEAYDWGSDVSASCWVLFIDYEQGNGDASWCWWGAWWTYRTSAMDTDSNNWTSTNSKYKSYV